MKNIFIQTNKSAILLALLAVNVSQVSASSSKPFSFQAMLRVAFVGALSVGGQANPVKVDKKAVDCCEVARGSQVQGLLCFLNRNYKGVDWAVIKSNSASDRALKNMGCCDGIESFIGYPDGDRAGFCAKSRK